MEDNKHKNIHFTSKVSIYILRKLLVYSIVCIKLNMLRILGISMLEEGKRSCLN